MKCPLLQQQNKDKWRSSPYHMGHSTKQWYINNKRSFKEIKELKTCLIFTQSLLLPYHMGHSTKQRYFNNKRSFKEKRESKTCLIFFQSLGSPYHMDTQQHCDRSTLNVHFSSSLKTFPAFSQTKAHHIYHIGHSSTQLYINNQHFF